VELWVLWSLHVRLGQFIYRLPAPRGFHYTKLEYTCTGIPASAGLLGVWLVACLCMCACMHIQVCKYVYYKSYTYVLIICIALHAKFLTNIYFNLVLLNAELIYELIIKITCLENNLVLNHLAFIGFPL